MSRDTRLMATFTIVDGQTSFDIENGDGQNCDALAQLFLTDADEADVKTKAEYHNTVSVGTKRTT